MHERVASRFSSPIATLEKVLLEFLISTLSILSFAPETHANPQLVRNLKIISAALFSNAQWSHAMIFFVVQDRNEGPCEADCLHLGDWKLEEDADDVETRKRVDKAACTRYTRLHHPFFQSSAASCRLLRDWAAAQCDQILVQSMSVVIT